MTIDIEKLIEEIDEDGSGQIEFDEFTALLSGGKPEDEEDDD
jgi:Ca2+-binding EF-hand superfamily protein